MDKSTIASATNLDVFRPRVVGEPINAHVVAPTKEPEPDFEKMQRVIEGRENGDSDS